MITSGLPTEIRYKKLLAVEGKDEVAFFEAVLAKMLEVEDYNELVDMVRSLIRDQEAIIERTKKEQRKKLLGPLGDGF